MATKMGVGYSIDAKSADAGEQAATAAMTELGSKKCQLAILFSTGKHDPGQLQRGVRAVIGADSKLIGGYSMGVITKDYLGYDGNQVGIALMSSDSAEVNMFLEPGLPDNEYNVGAALGRQIRSRQYSGKPNILFMYDSVKKGATEGVSLNMATPLVEGLGQSLGAWPSAAGVGMVGDLGFNPTRQWFNDRIETGSAMALVLSGSMQMDTVIMHGCYPASSYHEVTKADGNVVLEIDHKPAVDMITEIMGPDANITPEGMPFFVTLGVNKGDKFGEYREEDYANRLVLAVDEQRKGLVMFEPNLTEGTEFQLMARNFDFQYVRDRSKWLLKRLADRRTVFALYIDCTARAGAFCGSEGEEAAAVQEVIGTRMPLLGIYSGVEIAKVGQSMQALDWTGVLCIFSE
ncbi:MAG: FIST N-terminal domain-containing protein [Desulfobacterales bacterium]|nr:FIST N-terminal domain-containing protein [Desulfobacterales bacterium]